MANALTLGRILLIIPFAATFFSGAAFAMQAAFIIFALAAATDFLDGWAARARGEASALGAALDPIADKMLIAAALLLLTRNGVIAGASVVAALIILSREILIAGLREALAGGAGALPVTRLAKIKTTAQLAAVGALLAAAPGGLVGPALRAPAEALLWIAALLTFATGASYAAAAVAALASRGRPPEA
jgi:CDP-diacylglycerol--glycerol-3-phosphate 3-phosphatidyltransferase